MTKRKQKKNRNFAWGLIMAVAVCVLLFSAYKIITILQEYRKGTDTYAGLQQYVSETAEDVQESSVDSVSVDDAKTYSESDDPGIEVDFDGLREVNEDIIGWLYIPSLDISYPILQGDDNEYYLHRLADKTINSSGSIFLEAENSPDFEDCNTIIYGHNMKNGSMFGKLKQIRSMDMTEQERKVWILTPDGNHLYRIFSANEVSSTGEVYTLFSGPGEEFTNWLYDRAANSIVDPGDITFGDDEKVITLSTCTGNSSTRFVVIAQRIS